MKTATEEGLGPSTLSRATVVPVHNAATKSKFHSQALEEMLWDRSPAEMAEMLGRPDVNVTNTSDKEKMLPFVEEVDAHVKRMFCRSKAQARPTKASIVARTEERLGGCFDALGSGRMSAVEARLAFEEALAEASGQLPGIEALAVDQLVDRALSQLIGDARESPQSGPLEDLFCHTADDAAAALVSAASQSGLDETQLGELYQISGKWLSALREFVIERQMVPTTVFDRELESIFNRMKLFREDAEHGDDFFHLHEEAKISLGKEDQVLSVTDVSVDDLAKWQRKRYLQHAVGARFYAKLRLLVTLKKGSKAKREGMRELEGRMSEMEAENARKLQQMREENARLQLAAEKATKRTCAVM